MAAPALPQYTQNPPSRSEPATFDEDADYFASFISTMYTPYNDFGVYFDALAVTTEGYKNDAETSAQAAAASGNFEGQWSTLTGAYSKGISVAHVGTSWRLINDVADITASEPGVSADWLMSAAQTQKVIPHTTAGTVIAGGIINQLRDSGSFTMQAASSVEDGVVCIIELPKKYDLETPTVNIIGSDLFEDEDGTDTEIKFFGSARITLTSNGINRWVL